MPLIAAEDLPSVRVQIDATVDLPDAVLLDPVLLTMTDQAVEARYPGAAAETDPARQETIRTAAVLWHASLAAPLTPTLVSERVTDYQYQRQPVDRAARAAWLRGAAEALLASLTTTTVDDRLPTLFDAATGRRGAWDRRYP